MNLWPVEHFFPPFFSRSVLIGGKFIFTKKSITRFAFQCNFNQSALIWKKTGGKSVQLVRGLFFRKYFLWNPYFKRTIFSHRRSEQFWKQNTNLTDLNNFDQFFCFHKGYSHIWFWTKTHNPTSAFCYISFEQGISWFFRLRYIFKQGWKIICKNKSRFVFGVYNSAWSGHPWAQWVVWIKFRKFGFVRFFDLTTPRPR